MQSGQWDSVSSETLKEFKEFVVRGNAIDMAVGISVGVAFGRVINSLVNDILMPPIGKIVGQVDFSGLYINLSSTPYASLAEAKKAGAPTINYGIFLNETINFLITALAIFLVIKQIQRLRGR